MGEYYLAVIVILTFLIFFVLRIRWNYIQSNVVLQYINEIKKSIIEFEELLNDDSYFNNRKLNKWLEKYLCYSEKITPKYKKVHLKSEIKSTLYKYFDYINEPRQYINQHNIHYENRRLEQHKSFFESIEEYPLEHNQRVAIVHEEDSNLIVAGAGCGKTTTLVGKLAYLTKIKNIPKEQILMLAFTRKASMEMKDRISKIIGEDFEIHTFHSFGLKILSEIIGEKPTLAFDGENKRVEDFIRIALNECSQDKKYARLLTEFFFYEFTTHIPDRKNENKPHSYLDEVMKSKQEAKIANFLFLNDIKYKYEESYKHKTATIEYRQYAPDFYLPDYDIYIEHFGIDENGNPPKDFFNPKKYIEGVKWKRDTHKKYNTTLIESYSYEASKNILFTNLKRNLESHGVEFHDLDYNEKLKTKIKKNDKTLLIDIICTFLNLFKSNQFTFEELIEKAEPSQFVNLYKSFLDVFKPLYDKYTEYLNSQERIDFNDMIVDTTKFIREKKYITPYKYILIDEFQDISVGRYKLINSLIEQRNDVQLFCVGDDWQSIFRFAGSDISLFVNFEKYFGHHKLTKIDNTFRITENIAKLSNEFIMKNRSQINKNLKSQRKSELDTYKIVYKTKSEDSQPLNDIIKEIANKKDNDKKLSVLILGRYNWDEPENLNSLKSSNVEKGLDINFLTIHKAKGLEADYIIVNNVISGFNGFPSQMLDHEVLNLVLQERETFPNAEERRLFYVAMTRTKNKLYIIGRKKLISEFIFDLCSSDTEEEKEKKKKKEICPTCNGKLIKRNGKRGEFWGCDNFPACNYTTNYLGNNDDDNLLLGFKLKNKYVNPSVQSRDDDLPF